MDISVGIKTDGVPVMETFPDYTLVSNMLIGDGFHWQHTIEARLPGKVEPISGAGVESGGADQRITLINRLPLETYLECVVGSEMNPDAPTEFLKAHAVISRSWAFGKISGTHSSGSQGHVACPDCIIGWDDTEGHNGFDVCSDDHCQRYQGLQDISPQGRKAIRTTAGQVLVNPEGSVVDARFSKCCGGTTEVFSTCWQDEEKECLKSFEDPWCNLSELDEITRKALLSTVLKDYDIGATEGYGYRWTEDVDKSLIARNLRERFGRDIGEIKNIEPLSRGASGRIDKLRVTGSKGSFILGKELWIRRLLSESHLYSSAFDIEDRGDHFHLSGKGWGHGVGLCQIGAANMARCGHDYKSILAFYYPRARVGDLRCEILDY